MKNGNRHFYVIGSVVYVVMFIGQFHALIQYPNEIIAANAKTVSHSLTTN